MTNFKEYLKNTKIKETFIEYDMEQISVLFEGTMQEYLEAVCGEDDEDMINLFQFFSKGSQKEITLRNTYGNEQIFEIV